MENSKIEWCDDTFNPWIGCTKVSPGCDHCYAETFAKRFNKDVWGKGKPRERTSEANWRKPLKWNRDAKCRFDTDGDGNCHIHPNGCPRPRVFCASLADWLDPEIPIEWLADLLDLIRQTPHLDWLLLTKRPEKWKVRLESWISEEINEEGESTEFGQWLIDWIYAGISPHNVWIGTTVENQAQANKRIPKLLEIPAKVRFLSCEPLLSELNLTRWLVQDHPPEPNLHWLICGGESGPGARPMFPDWARSLRDQCQAAGVPFLFKQWGEWLPVRQIDESKLIGQNGQQFHMKDIPEEWPKGKPVGNWWQVFNSEGWRVSFKAGKRSSGRLLDGREWNGFPIPDGHVQAQNCEEEILSSEDEHIPEECAYLFSELTGRESRVMKTALSMCPGENVRCEADWLKCRGLGKKLLEKLRNHGMIDNRTPDELSSRACNVLCNVSEGNSFPEKDQIKSKLESGDLNLLKYRNCGVKTEDEIRRWVGLPPIQPPSESRYIPRKLWKYHPLTGKPYSETADSLDDGAAHEFPEGGHNGN